MDTNRIKIYNHDLSTATTEVTTEYSGFTVVRAPKGPITPIRLNANSAATMQDIFGVSSAEYPELFEAEVYNSTYDLYLSAPYFGAQVPVAYLTTKGWVTSDDLVDYTTALEYYSINGNFEGEEKSITNVNAFSSFPKVLKSLTEQQVIFSSEKVKIGVDEGTNLAPSYTDFLVIKISEGFTTLKVGDLANTPGNTSKPEQRAIFYKDKKYKISGVSLKNKEIGFTLKNNSTGSETQECDVVDDQEKVIGQVFVVYKNGANTRCRLMPLTENCNPDDYEELSIGGSRLDEELNISEGIYVLLYGNKDSKVLTPSNIITGFNEEIDRANLVINKVVTLDQYLNVESGTKAEDVIHAVLLPKFPSSNTLYVNFEPFNNRNYNSLTTKARNILKVSAYEENCFHNSIRTAVTFTGSLDYQATGVVGFNATNTDYLLQNLVTIIPLKPFTADNNNDFEALGGYGSLALSGGTRNVTIDETDPEKTSAKLHALGWKAAANPEYSEVDVFFDCEEHILKKGGSGLKKATASAKYPFFALAKEHKLSGFIFNYTVDPDILKVTDQESSDYKLVQQYQLDFGEQYWNICNELLVDLSDGSRIRSTMVGSRSLMQTRIIEYMYGGVAPEFLNSGSPGMGGQLPGLLSTKLRFKYNKDMQGLLDEMNFNPVVSDRTYGLMLTGHKTCKSGDLTDWSYIGHVSAFLNFEKEIKKFVMDPQLGKANNPYYRELRKYQAEEILAKRLEGTTRIWAEGIVDTSTADGINDVQALRARQFRIQIKVKVDVFSEYVILDFTNVDQGTNLY